MIANSATSDVHPVVSRFLHGDVVDMRINLFLECGQIALFDHQQISDH